MTKHLGNVFNTSLNDIWKSALVQEIREFSEEGKLHSFCENWDGCPYVLGRDRVMKDFNWNNDGPIRIEMCLPSTHCNIGGTNPNSDNPACLMCVRNFKFHRAPDRSLEIATHIKPFMPQLVELFIGGVAEPFWKDKIFSILDLLEFQKHADKVQLQTVTNGTTLTDQTIDRLLEIKRFHVYASIDAGTSDTFRKLRRIDAYDKIKKNIATICRRKSCSQFIEIHNTINLLNVHELVKMVQDAKEMGVDRLGLNITHNPGFGYQNIPDLNGILLNPSNSYLFEEWHQKAIEEAERLNVKLATYKKFNSKKKSPEKLVEISMPDKKSPEKLVSISLPTKPTMGVKEIGLL